MFSLAKPKRIAGAIEVYEDAFHNCTEIINVIERNPTEYPWQRAETGGGDITDKRTSDSTFINFSALTNPTVVYEFGRTLYQYLDAYGKRYDVGFSQIEAACLNKYDVDEEYKPHADDGPGMPRVISALIYMNDVKDGGETRFTLFDEEVKPKAGRLVIFPSNYAYIHQALPPKSGVKYSMAVWTTPVR
jgi:predicted 2-oxoglutarate/Fe(II)-dependent dioxygenase YbiX